MSRCWWLVAGLICGLAAPGWAQPVPRTITCADVSGGPVAGIQAANGIIAKATIDQDGRRVVQYDPRTIEGVSSQQQLFVYAHECGHHALGHLSGDSPFTAAQEPDADCYGIRSLMAKVGFTSDDVAILEMAMRDVGADGGRHLSWRTRAYDLQGCLPEVIARRQAAARSGETSADDCVVHHDGENAIVGKSRDGRVIDGVYSVRNRCTRDVTCVFTIEIGTLLDSDIDVGSTRSFRVQKTITEQHTLRSAQGGSVAAAEFRVRGTVDPVPTGESADFRVVMACKY
jgi:hypothetical protein